MGKTYPQDYDGPDLYNYNYMDLTPYGILEDLQTLFTNSYKLVEADGIGWKYKHKLSWLGGEIEDEYEEIPINYIVNEGGIRMKPLTVTGSRRMEGTIQTAYRNYIAAYLNVKNVLSDYDTKLTILKEGVKMAKSMEADLWKTFGIELGVTLIKLPVDTMDDDYHIELGDFTMNLMMIDSEMMQDVIPGISSVGTTIAIDPKSLFNSPKIPFEKMDLYCFAGMQMLAYETRHKKQYAGMFIDLAKTVYDLEEQIRGAYKEIYEKIDGLAMDLNLSILAIQPAFAELSAAEAAYRAQVEIGQQLQEQRALWRQQVSNGATEQRYLDMYNRVQRNLALTKYTTAFDTAQRYVSSSPTSSRPVRSASRAYRSTAPRRTAASATS